MTTASNRLKELFHIWLQDMQSDDLYVHGVKRRVLVNEKKNGGVEMVLISEEAPRQGKLIGRKLHQLNFVFKEDNLVTCNCEYEEYTRAMPISKPFFRKAATGEFHGRLFSKWLTSGIRIIDLVALDTSNERHCSVLFKEANRIFSNALKNGHITQLPL